MRIAILGVGAIGGMLAGALATTSADLVLYSRGGSAYHLSSVGLRFHSPFSESAEDILPERWVVCEGELSQPLLACADVAIICGKSSATSALAQVAEQVLRPTGVAFSIQNGLGHADLLVARLGRHRTLAAAITHGATRISEGEVKWAGQGDLHIGTVTGSELDYVDRRVSQLFEVLHQANLNPAWAVDSDVMIWSKLLVNVAINPLAAICGVRNGEILARPELHSQALSAMQEAAVVGIAEGVDLADLDCERMLNNVLNSTAENRCSMLQDVMAGRKTEIDSLCGEVVRRGEENGIPTPLNQQLLAMVHGIEHSMAVN